MVHPGVVLKERYEIIQVLRRSNISTVSLARDRRSHERLPLRIAYGDLHPDSIRSPFFASYGSQASSKASQSPPAPRNGMKIIKGVTAADKRLFDVEARILIRLDHPSIVHVTDYFVWANEYYVVMEHLPGENLSEYLVRQPQNYLSERESLLLIIPVLDALDYMYNRVFMHFTHGFIPAPGEISPHHIHITPARRVVLIFSSVWTGDSDGQMIARSRPLRSDLYMALGMLLYTMLTGTQPPTIEQRINGTPLAPLRGHNLSVSPAMEQIVLRLLAVNPADRYATMDELRQALLQIGKERVKSTSTTATRHRSDTTSQSASVEMNRHWFVVSVVTAVAAICALIFVVAGAPPWW